MFALYCELVNKIVRAISILAYTVVFKRDFKVEDFAQRLRFVLRDESVNAVANRSGVSEATIRKYLAGKTTPGVDKVKLLADTLGCSFEWLAVGSADNMMHALRVAGESHKEEMAIRLRKAAENATHAAIPHIDAVASAGGGNLVLTESSSSYISLSKSWLSNKGLSAGSLFTEETSGESMEPTIKAGEILICSRAEHHLRPGDGIYVVRLEGHVLVKRLQVLPKSRLMVTSDNKAYASYEIQLNDGVDFQLLGKVLFTLGLRAI